ncbi:hypothetical protein M501DRAFT_1003381 [Patellaria atrata CBS 101060]|uniref:DUF6590 domain-containing protein n=1 Tax=Patellaria atrata CBS 101060 TaxID=1346257 RepID=A0A9P4VTT3_9PEZI|nr:hypothetical protein M501DRAFT_1003381 [Patellaria atrata CBS 101060]
MFACLFTEGMGATANPDLSNPNVSVVRYGEYAYTDIRRFVVVQERRGFCLALPVSTYSQRGCTKCPEKAREHGIIYTSEYEPQPITGEPPFIYQSIKIKPVTDDIYLHSASRINFAETKSIQTNVKVKEIGNVIDEHLNLLDLQWKQEQNRGWP